VFLHGFSECGASMRGAIAALRETEDGKDTDVFAPDLPFGALSRASPIVVMADLLCSLDALWAKKASSGTPYVSVVFIGHSMGSLFARKLYMAGLGETAEAPFENELKSELDRRGCESLSHARPWAVATQRMSLWRGATMSIGVALNRLVEAFGGRSLVVMSAQRGAPFITQLRLQWLARRKQSDLEGRRLVPVVQLLGTQDDLVPPSANIDPVTGNDFIYLEVPQSGHATVIQMGTDAGDTGAQRRAVFQRALTIDTETSPFVPLVVGAAPKPNPDVDDVVFVIHGIRDLGYWTEKIGLRIARHAMASCSQRIALETSTYGYFPLLSFLRPGARQQKVEWLMDRITEAKSRFPNASLSYVGHSHGTYLIKKAMRDYPAVRFKHIVLAGSVLRTDENWAALLAAGRVAKVLNFVASADWVVAFFPNAMQLLRWQDVGGAGHRGFSRPAPGLVQMQGPHRYIVGRHSAALDEGWWDSIAGFVLHGKFQPAPMPTRSSHSWWVTLGAAVAPLLWLVIPCVLGWLLWELAHSCLREWLRTVLIILSLSVIWTVLTKV
jgi:pimeloyl-ACP methyl ester carboxylesterase